LKNSVFKQLPAGLMLAFQALSATFTNQCNWHASNWWLTVGLVTVLSATCVFSSFTDSVVYNGKVHKGVAFPGRLHLNLARKEQQVISKELRKRGLKSVDCLHAVLRAVVFLTIAGSDVVLQNCFFPKANDDTQQLLRNLPPGMSVMSSFMFMIFPTTRKSINFSGDTECSPSPPATCSQQNQDGEQHKDVPIPMPESDGTNNNALGRSAAADNDKLQVRADKVLTSSANLLQLLPTGSVLAFQTLSSAFTNQGSCYRSNWWLTVGLVTFLGSTCVFFPFTDSVRDCNDKVYKGVALPSRLHVFNLTESKQKELKDEFKKRRLKAVDFVHAFFTLVVFLTIAGSDVGLQNCFFPNADDGTRQLLKNLPLGMAVMSSFVFMIVPTTREGISFDDNTYSVIPVPPTDNSSARVAPSQVPIQKIPPLARSTSNVDRG
jgi:hypothetical protein